MSTPKIYLAGPIAGMTYVEAMEWRNEIELRIGEDFELLSPMRDKWSLVNKGVLHGSYKDSPLCTASGVLLRDETDLSRCDAALIYLPDGCRSVDTLLEMGYLWATRKPMIVVTTEPYLIEHPFFARMAKTLVVPDFGEAYNVLYSLFNL